MKPIGCVWIPVLACVDMLSYGEANAQGRGPDVRELRTEAHARAAVEAEKATDPAMRAARLGELEVWLKRVVGDSDGRVSVPWLHIEGGTVEQSQPSATSPEARHDRTLATPRDLGRR